MIKVFIIGKTQVDFPTLFSVCKQVLGRSVSNILDEVKAEAKVPSGYIPVLMDFKSPGSKSVAALRNPGFTLHHIHYTFLVICTPEVISEIQQQTNLQTLSEKSQSGFALAILTGSLDQWRSAIINGLSQSCGFGLRTFLDYCLFEFDKEGLGPMFQDYDRVNQPDKTLTLRKRI